MKKLLFVIPLVLLLTGCAVADNPAFIASNQRVIVQGVDAAGNVYDAAIDDNSQALQAIEVEHAELHEGNFYSTCYIQDVGNAANVTIELVTPSDVSQMINIRYEISAEVEATFYLYENASTSGDGTPMTPFNRNRNYADEATVAVYRQPTVTEFGDLLCSSVWGSGRGVGGGTEPLSELVLKPATTYLFVVVNNTALDNQMDIKLGWYKHEF